MKKVLAYTDGACKGNPGPGGWGVVLKFGPHEKDLAGGVEMTTNNQMELQAVLAAVEALKQPVELHVHTDSELVVNWMTGKIRRKQPAIRELCGRIERLAGEKDVKLVFHKVPGHAGDPLNERAHALASGAAEKAKAAREPVLA